MKTKHYYGSMPHIIDEITKDALDFNMKNPRGFIRCERCITYALNGSRLLAIGYNQRKTHTFTKMYHEKLKNSIDAEADMIMKLIKNDNLTKVTDIVVFRGSTKPLNSYPCKICQGLLKTYLDSVRLWWYDYNNKEWKLEIL